MNGLNRRNGIIIVVVLLVLVLVVWGLVIAGWVKGSSGSPSPVEKGNSDTTQTERVEETTSAEPSVETSLPTEPGETHRMESSVETSSPSELDASGIWDMTFRRYYAVENEGSWEPIGIEEIFLWVEIFPGEQFECDIMPYEGTINGEPYGDSLAVEPQLHTGEVDGNTIRLYLDLDSFYLNPTEEIVDTIQPDYVEIPITTENGLPGGSYDHTWVTAVDDYELQSRVAIELKKR